MGARPRSIQLYSDNPFNPGFGVPPPMLAGRHELLRATLSALQRGARRHDFHTILVGARGTGKTVMLAEIERAASTESQMLAMHWSGTEPLHQRLTEQRSMIEQHLRTFAKRGLRRLNATEVTLKAAPAGIGAEATIAGRRPTEPATLSTHGLLEMLARQSAERQRTIVLFADEMQAANPDDLRDLGVSLQQLANVQGLPLALVGAGLPHTRQTLLDAKVTFLERLHLTPIGLLDDAATRDAIEVPFVHAGRRLEPKALDLLANASGGYPYAIQLLGSRCWDAAGELTDVGAVHARAAVKQTRQYLEENVFEGTWRRISPADRYVLYMAAQQADSNDTAETSAIARALNRPIASITAPRDRLINRHGVLYAPERGAVRFILPGFAAWVHRHGDQSKPQQTALQN